jgi:hypothetical protein
MFHAINNLQSTIKKITHVPFSIAAKRDQKHSPSSYFMLLDQAKNISICPLKLAAPTPRKTNIFSCKHNTKTISKESWMVKTDSTKLMTKIAW